ncbi:hypothetical protein PRUB_a4048 [Pseudoalteromonas rubra]|uniref:Uncharacterized protein n=1 Tax=Pseudoalteromonas rubra TaxID=43658 RepID=A0A8T0CAS6_9GAMM|nr:hypothetical protein [Pseudoalteromonas rubra]KAF7787172.1 hypothetical protein PRUB_a4048 [Pseudoalteromonas rubra]
MMTLKDTDLPKNQHRSQKSIAWLGKQATPQGPKTVHLMTMDQLKAMAASAAVQEYRS